MAPGKKGMKPMLNRLIARDWHLRRMEKVQENFPTVQSMEHWFSQKLYKKVKFNYSSEIGTDELQWVRTKSYSTGGKFARGDDGEDDADSLYKRKFIDPTPFKKMEIVKWEMPENFTSEVTLKELVDVGAQFGHNAGAWNPKMYKYLYAEYDGQHIFDLVQTAAGINRACYYLKEAASKGALILFLGTKVQAQEAVKDAGESTGMPYCDQKALGGMISNYDQVSQQRLKVEKMEEEMKLGLWDTFPAADQEKNRKELEELRMRFGGLRTMSDVPHIAIVVDECAERKTVLECKGIGIPIIGLLDSNNKPDFVDIGIPCNTTSKQCIELILGKLAAAVASGKAEYDSKAPGDRVAAKKQWDPWAFGKQTVFRQLRRKQKRQDWMKVMYGSYEKYKETNPYGHIPKMPAYRKFSWDD